MAYGEIQLGKNGITASFIENLKNRFKDRENIKISVLKSAGHNKEKVKEYSEEIINALGKNYTAKLIGFKIILRKWRKSVKLTTC